ncbi:MAG: 4-alpha-glucanotransferase, partial [Alphaproteobacteria bacterium]|nr:4-alpha-glucanotransferase [Alphaproteobacteria bacterium]
MMSGAGSDDWLDRLAAAHGIQARWEREDGGIAEATQAAKRGLLSALGIDPSPAAWQALQVSTRVKSRQDIRARGSTARKARCYVPRELQRGRRCWGVTCQLYGLRSNRNFGIGDFHDLLTLGRAVAAEGAAFLGVSPLHALFAAEPIRFSPYSPSSRRFLNPLYIALDWIEASAGTAAAAAAAERLRHTRLVDYEGVGALKMAALRRAYEVFRDSDAGAALSAAERFEDYLAARGEPLAEFACFEALSEEMYRNGHGCGWIGWPGELRDKTSPAVEKFKREAADEIRFYAWLQWTAETQLARVQSGLLDAGMLIGLYLDIAVGVAPDGAETWSSPGATLG